MNAKIKVRVTETHIDDDGNHIKEISIKDTVAGRLLIWNIMPLGMAFEECNQEMTKKTSRV